MKDKDFLIWIHNRIKNVYGESPNVDFLYKLRAVIREVPKEKETPSANCPRIGGCLISMGGDDCCCLHKNCEGESHLLVKAGGEKRDA